MKSILNFNRPTKALLSLLIPALYLLILNKSLWFILYLVFNVTVKQYSDSTLVLLLNVFAGAFFFFETIVYLYSRKRKFNEY